MRQIFVIVNPRSGSHQGLSILRMTETLLTQNGIKHYSKISKYRNHPFDLAHTENLESYDAIAVIGGDGTMHEVINGMLKRSDGKRLPIALITAGTGNSLMHDLNCLDPEQAILNLINGQKRKIDIFRITGESKSYFAFNILLLCLSGRRRLFGFSGERTLAS